MTLANHHDTSENDTANTAPVEQSGRFEASSSWHERASDVGLAVGLYALAVAVALAISALLVLVADGSPTEVFRAMWSGAFGSARAFGNTLNAAAPLGVVALGAAVANRAGLFNIGQEGQLSIGAGFAVWAAISFPGPGTVKLIAALIAGTIGGALWASIAGVAKYRFSVNEVISTLLLNFVAFQALIYALDRTFLLKPELEGALPPQSGNVPPDARLPTLERLIGVPSHTGIVLMLALTLLTGFVLVRTVWGGRVDLLGMNPALARRAGVSEAFTGSFTLAIAGGAAGLAGAVMLTGVVFRVDPGFSNNVGWTGLLVGLVARNRPLAIPFVAIGFGAIQAGGNLLAATGVPRATVDVVGALVVLASVVPPLVLDARARQRSTAAAIRSERTETLGAPA
jgi:general nucleoside transport system permease protein